jgi:nicotinate-nucleotide adenylyltransferase
MTKRHQQKTRALGILGGTFDPIHLGHLRLALELHDSLNLSKVHVIPCYRPVHRKLPVATPEQRLAMVECAVTGEPALYADPREIRRQNPSYMIDTILELREEMPGAPLCLLIGIDAFLGFPSWHRWREIMEESHLIVAHRPQYQLPATGEVADLLKERLKLNHEFIHEHQGGGILLMPITQLEISASDIRKQIAMGRNPRYLLPDRVYDYIKQFGTYSINRISL